MILLAASRDPVEGAIMATALNQISSGDIPNSMWNPGGTLVEPSWNLTSGPPRTTPEPIWAETPKLSAVGEKKTFCNYGLIGTSLHPPLHHPTKKSIAPSPKNAMFRDVNEIILCVIHAYPTSCTICQQVSGYMPQI